MIDYAALLVDLAESLDHALTVPHSPIQEAMRRVMQEPRFGDLVVVLHARRDTPAADRVGHYVERWAEQVDGRFAFGFTVHTLDGREVRWTNATMVRVSGVEDAARDALDARRSPAPTDPTPT